MNFAIPTVETERLVLREFRSDDLDAFAAMSADAEVMRYIGDGAVVDKQFGTTDVFILQSIARVPDKYFSHLTRGRR